MNLVFVGTYSRRGSEGVYAFGVDDQTGALTPVATARAENPSFLALSPDRRFLYSVNEQNEFEGRPGGGASAFAVNGQTGELALVNQQPIHAAGPCHAEVDPTGRWLATANYTGGSHSILPIGEDGRLGALRMLIRHAPEGQAKAHSTLFSPDARSLTACALGLNQVIAYEFDPDSGMASPGASVEMPPGAGPRHQVLHPPLPILYVLNETGSSVSAIAREAASLRLLQTLPTIPADFTEHNAGADLHLSPDARFLYGSNRGHNSLAVFAVGADGLLAPLGQVSTEGNWPRGFAVLRNGIILVANERSDEIVAFRIGEDGMPVPIGTVTSVPSPTCVVG